MLCSEALRQFLLSLDGVRARPTIAWYQSRIQSLIDFIGDKPAQGVTIAELRTWRTSFEKQSSWSRHSFVRCTRRWFKWMLDEGIIKNNVALRFEVPKPVVHPKPGISHSDMLRMVAVASESKRDYALLLFFADTGCRIGGAAGLRLADLDLDSHTAYVIEKGNQKRPVFFGSITAVALRLYLKSRTDSLPCVFMGKYGEPLQVAGIYHIFERIAKAANVKANWNPHQWRHGCARALLKRGANLAEVSQLLGHRDIRVTSKFYGSFDAAELKKAHDKFSWVPRDEAFLNWATGGAD